MNTEQTLEFAKFSEKMPDKEAALKKWYKKNIPKIVVPYTIRTTVKPDEIQKGVGFGSSIWRNMETEASAYYLVKMAQKNGSWRDFTKAEIDKIAKEDFWFNYLRYNSFGASNSTNDSILFNPNPMIPDEIEWGTYSFTDKFINEVYRLRPVK